MATLEVVKPIFSVIFLDTYHWKSCSYRNRPYTTAHGTKSFKEFMNCRIFIEIYCHVHHGCVVVCLLTLRRVFGLDTGFIHYGDYNYTDCNY
jgi:hypothetical protein